MSLGISLSSMATTAKLMCIVLFLLHLHPSCSGPVSGQIGPLESVPELEKAMYITLDGYPCVRLLNLSGEIGCANPGRDKVVAPIVKFDNALELAQGLAISVRATLNQRLSRDSKFAMNIGGVLVESKTELQKESDGFSPVEKFPQAEFAPYKRTSYEWNPNGFGIIRKPYNFPVFLLSPGDTLTLQEVALKNAKRGQPYAVDVAEFNLVMQTTKAGTHNSESCLKESTCLPLGGYGKGKMGTLVDTELLMLHISSVQWL
ncbi:Nicastrin, small lobe [Dillenia turbinata]|uniref:Nicastrin n=1 Tax=Dillenia turbinata TaxID=194707 RepID=A0AAN8ZA19_9MAGN